MNREFVLEYETCFPLYTSKNVTTNLWWTEEEEERIVYSSRVVLRRSWSKQKTLAREGLPFSLRFDVQGPTLDFYQKWDSDSGDLSEMRLRYRSCVRIWGPTFSILSDPGPMFSPTPMFSGPISEQLSEARLRYRRWDSDIGALYKLAYKWFSRAGNLSGMLFRLL